MNEPCWICGAPSVWRVIGEKEGPPVVIVEFFACEKHAPFEIQEKEKANAANA